MNSDVKSQLLLKPLPTVDFFHPDPLGDEDLFAEPIIYRRYYGEISKSPYSQFTELGASNWPDILRYIIGDADAGFLTCSVDHGDDGFVIIRRRDWAALEGEVVWK